MLFGLLGNIRIGNAVWTGPNAAQETRKASLPEHQVARGKPVVQDTGDALDTKELEFFFDETFCDARAELAKLEMAFAMRIPMPFVGGDGSFTGVSWLVEEFSVTTLKTTPSGRVVRMKVSARLKEVPVLSPLALLQQIARSAASALSGIAGLNPGTRR